MAAEWRAKAVIEKLIDISYGCLNNQFKFRTGMKEELERLQMNYLQIQAVLDAATKVQIRDPAQNKWLWQLRDAIDETDDLLDEFEYMKHKERVTRNTRETEESSNTDNTEKIISTFRQMDKVVLDPLLKKLEDVVHELDIVSAGFVNFPHLLEVTKKGQHEQERDFCETRGTGSGPINIFIGRSKEKDYIIAWLRQPSNDNISLLSIVGHGGMGKTTLVQHVCGDDRITVEFDLKISVCVSINSDSKKVIADMLKRSPQVSLDILQEALKSAVQSKKFLLVLDDIWDDEQRNKIKWEDVLAPLAYGKFGSKILITTRVDSVAAKIAKIIGNEKKTLILKGMEEDDCLQLLNAHAFADEENSGDHEKLRSITAEIVKRLWGSPLAAALMGGTLNERLDEEYWNSILNSLIRNTESSCLNAIQLLQIV